MARPSALYESAVRLSFTRVRFPHLGQFMLSNLGAGGVELRLQAACRQAHLHLLLRLVPVHAGLDVPNLAHEALFGTL